MNGPSNIVHLHRGHVRRPMSGAQIVSLNGDTEAAFDDRVDLDEWLNRPSKRIGFHPPIDWADLASKAIIVAGLGACVAMWLS